MESRFSKLITIATFVLLAIAVAAIVFSTFFKKYEDKEALEKIRKQKAREVEELARMNDLLQRQLEETEKLPDVKKSAKLLDQHTDFKKGGNLVDLTPELKKLPVQSKPAPGKKKKHTAPQANKKTGSPQNVAEVMTN